MHQMGQRHIRAIFHLCSLTTITHQVCHRISRLILLITFVLEFHLIPVEGRGGEGVNLANLRELPVWILIRTFVVPMAHAVFFDTVAAVRLLPIVHHLCHRRSHTTCDTTVIGLIASLVVIHVIAVRTHVIIGCILSPFSLDQR